MQPRYTPSRPWAPLSQAELTALAPYFAQKGAGRPIFDIRARLDAIFWVVTSPHPWRCLPTEMGPADTAHRQFRRWAHAGIWSRLLQAVAQPKAPPALKALEHWICRAYRRALRILKLPGIVLARRLGMASAVNAPFWLLPDPDLSESLLPRILAAVRGCIGGKRRAVLEVLDAAKRFHRLVGGRKHLPKCLAPP